MTTATAPWWALIASFGPLVALAALGLRRPRSDRDWMLILWPIATAAVYFLVPQFPPHALSGVTVPLAILAVRGWARASAWASTRARSAPRGPGHGPRPAFLGALVAVAAIAAVTVPAAIRHSQGVGQELSNTFAGGYSQALFRLSPDQAHALDYIDRAPGAGGVLAPALLSLSVPPFTGRQTYAGHVQWQPAANVALTNSFFDPGLSDPSGAVRRAILRRTGARFVVGDCNAPAALTRDIAPIARPVRRFGCLTVYETRR
jgi:hypothetical protein